MGADQGKNYDHEVAVAHTSLIWFTLADLHLGGVPHSRKLSRGHREGDGYLEDEKAKGIPRGQGVREGAYVSR